MFLLPSRLFLFSFELLGLRREMDRDRIRPSTDLVGFEVLLSVD